MGWLFNEYFGNTILQYFIFLSIIIVSWAVGKLFSWFSIHILKRLAAKTKSSIDDFIIDSIRKPIIFLLFVLGFIIARNYLFLSVRVEEIYFNVVKILLTIDVAWFLSAIIGEVLNKTLVPLAKKTKTNFDNTVINLIIKSSKILIWVVAIVLILDNVGYDITSLIAGLGIGGLAFALAAQDLLSNMFGGAAIFTDKVFTEGDRIKVGSDIDGIVKKIGLRTTRIKTFDGTELVVPNKIISNSVLENVAKEEARRIKMRIGITYDTSSKKIVEAKKILSDIVKKNKYTKDESIISFTDFADSAIILLLVYWITKDAMNKDKYFETKDTINSEIKRLFDKAKIEFAYPTQTIFVKK